MTSAPQRKSQRAHHSVSSTEPRRRQALSSRCFRDTAGAYGSCPCTEEALSMSPRPVLALHVTSAVTGGTKRTGTRSPVLLEGLAASIPPLPAPPSLSPNQFRMPLLVALICNEKQGRRG
ncbi:Hypothetical protein SMAX5B_020273 [Scophthalmus maximus]|uniref:Uncharacterized protein n=1 Tax=Scophthalmus maximus TaxID=52904 RepID=A0A2U9CML3_SCOMX|nr:Hypothetical protein SMAX5B_020273 [Scophthalmus maximus]